ncbi:MAG: hypothetical protein JNK01_08475 [Devosia sp.]|nr:hypothetical protein [Devosia sp.]
MFETLKTFISEFVGISKDALQVHLGLAVYVLAMAAFRVGPASIKPVVAVLVVELLNEVSDTFHYRHGAWQVWNNDPTKDIVNTILWPVVIFAFFWLRSRWLARRLAEPSATPPTGS